MKYSFPTTPIGIPLGGLFPNVLYRAKVSDYGTANFMQQTMTVAPGAMIYSAPEALTSNQTVKVSISEHSRLLTY